MKKFMRNCAITALCLIGLGLALTIVTGSYIGKKTIKDTVKTVMDGALDTIHSANNAVDMGDELKKDSVEKESSKGNIWKKDVAENSANVAKLFEAENASEAIAALQSLDEETKEELMNTLENSLDAETMEKVNQAMEGLLGEEELTALLEELNDSLDLESKLELASQMTGLLGEEVEFDIEDSIAFSSNYPVMSGDVEKTALGNGVIDMNLKVGGASFRVKASENDQYYVEAEDVSKFQAYVEGACLYINTLKASANTIDASKITLYVPAGSQLDSLWAELGAGQIVIENLNAKKQDITVGAGQITLKDIQAETMTVEVGLGELVATDVVVDSLNAEVGMGHMLLKGAINKDANIECAMGGIEVECQGEKDDFNYEINAALGEVVIGDREYTGVKQEQKINNNASKDMRLKCAMGSLVIDFEN